MPKIYDNIEHHLITGLNETLDLSTRADFCVGYFNLRGWKQVADQIDRLTGETVYERNESPHRICRLLVGLQKGKPVRFAIGSTAPDFWEGKYKQIPK